MNFILSIRSYNTNASCTIKKSAKLIRNEFLDYFKKDLGHTFIRSSPVVPLNDYTIAFVNAGMNQFKGVFLDYYDPPVKKVANSQKCIRISGKHNDLNVVGNDTYHHTFFEMLGSWSFGDYFKEEACRYAWNLLTKQYGINKEFLYVTYFGGDEKLELEPDLECKDVWLNIGVAKDKIIPFGLKENFWEMDISGPCGPCTEIHIDYTKQFSNQFVQINKDYSNLTELWNIVFIQYQRLTNGTVTPLPKCYIDTGMGLERLVALLQGKTSNYDTDLFLPLFKAIQKYTKAPAYKGKFYNDENGIDRGYRILGDHSRMITVALADGMVPQQSYKLRRIIRKAIDVGEQIFKKQGILSELSYTVAESLGDVYPELQNNLKKVQKIVTFEEELYKTLKDTSIKKWKKLVVTYPRLASITECSSPGLLDGYRYLQSIVRDLKTTNILPGNVAAKLYDTYGLHAQTISELAKAESLHFDQVAFQNELEIFKNRSRIGPEKYHNDLNIRKFLETLEKNHIPKTDDSFKYKYVFDENNYQFPKIESRIIALIVNDNLILNQENAGINEDVYLTISKKTADYNTKSDKDEIGIILDKTLCYSSEGGQMSDKGSICTKDLNFSINNVKKFNGYVIHFGKFSESNVKKWSKKIGDICTVSIKPEFRIGIMQHYTGAHLLNAYMKQMVQAVYEYSSLILPYSLRLQFDSFGEKLSLKQLEDIEKFINSVIEADVPVTTKVLNSLELLIEDSVILKPGEIYPYTGIRIVEIDFHDLKLKKACCGIHVCKTGILQYFCFASYSSKGLSKFEVKAIVGSLATSAKLAGENMQCKILNLEQKVRTKEITYEAFTSIRKEIEDEISNKNKEIPIPYLIKNKCLMKLEHLNDLIWKEVKEMEKSSVNMDIKNATDSTCSFIVHHLREHLMYLSLHEVVSLYPNIPILIITYNNEIVKAKCSVPQEIVSDKFNAQTWMKIIFDVFGGKCNSTKNPLLFAGMRAINISEASKDDLIHKAVEEAKTFASAHMSKI